ncbi:alpha-hydroxy-acid oxidizing protein [Pusillimonas caeni]|uniref:alpha-hydroxy acid oxidase n=1 Tax=Pusillimonas caeni TaxID=1348472 RepID=UPI000E59A7DD|nr:alpha-hydroxy acid oxidase [Pusillimonas caeni]TFL08476.1 alpha-hydroxy-acid oxidizing protein [Pusillimonas caeni]
MQALQCVEDARRQARRRIPKMFYEFVDSGSWTGSTYADNEAAFAALKFRQRIGKNVDQVTSAATILGGEAALPLAVAPTGLAGFVWPDAEILGARAAHRFGVPYSLSIGSVCSLEDVRKHTDGPLWMQVSLLKDTDFLQKLIRRAKKARCEALILTMDYHVAGRRYCDARNGLTLPPRRSPRQMLDLLSSPRWCLAMLRTSNRGFGNVIGHAKGVSDLASFAKWHANQFVLDINWDQVKRLKEAWDGRLIVKGVLDAEDALLAIDAGADALSISNQGGRQLDGAPAAVQALPSIVDAVGGKAELLLDGGVRSGQDIVRACALGASGVLAGRAWLYGVAAGGEDGVYRVLQILREEMLSTMAFCGVRRVSEIGPHVLYSPASIRRQQS